MCYTMLVRMPQPKDTLTQNCSISDISEVQNRKQSETIVA